MQVLKQPVVAAMGEADRRREGERQERDAAHKAQEGRRGAAKLVPGLGTLGSEAGMGIEFGVGPSRRLLALAGGLYAALALWVGGGVLRDPSHLALGSPGDNFEYLWRLWWFKDALLHFRSPFFVPNVLYPDGWYLGTAETATAYNVLGLPITALVGEVAAFNIFTLGLFVVAGLGAFLLTHRLTRSGPAALLAGVAFSICPYRIAHTVAGTLDLAGAAWMPWTFWFLELTMDSRRPRHAVGAAVAYSMTALSSWYYAYFMGLFVPFYVWLRLRGQRRRIITRRGLAATLLFIAVTVVLVMPALLPVLRLPPDHPMRHSMWALAGHSASPTDFIIGNAWHPLWGAWVRRHLTSHVEVIGFEQLERTLFLGWTALALSAIGLFRSRRPGAAAYFWVGLAAFVLALGPALQWNGHLVSVAVPHFLRPLCTRLVAVLTSGLPIDPSAVLATGRSPVFLPAMLLAEALPIFIGMRMMARFGVLAALAVAVLAGFGLARLTAGRPRRTQWLIALAALAAVVFEFAPSVSVSRLEPSATDRWLARQPGEFTIAYLPVEGLWNPLHLYASRWHGKRLMGAYGAFKPPALEARERALEGFPDAAAHRVLVACGVKYVLVSLRPGAGGISAPWLREAARFGDTVIYEVRSDRPSA